MFRFFSILLFTFSITLNINFAQHFEQKCSHAKTSRQLQLLKINYPGDQNIDITYYKLDLTITAIPEYVSGTATIGSKAIEDNLNQIILDFADSMKVLSVKTGETNLNFAHQNNLLSVSLDRNYSANEYIELDVNYEGRPDASYWGSFVFHHLDDYTPVIWSLSQPYGTSAWFPCKDTPADKADSSDVWLTVKDTYIGVSNGKLESETDLGNGFKTYKWKSRYPISQYLISVAISDYKVVQTPWEYEPGKTMPVTHYLYQNTDATQAQLEETVNMLSVYSDLFGQYPFINEKYGHAEWSWGGAMEHQTCSTMGAFYQDIVAHELAHQWFGDLITCKDWNNIWLNEGFATYCEVLYQERKFGFASAMNKFSIDYAQALNADGPLYVSDEDADPENPSAVSNIFNGNRSYAKGSVVLHMLRGVVGDDNFFNILKTYVNDEQVRFGAAGTDDFQRVAEAVSGMDLDYFFNQWIYGENYPIYLAGWSYSPGIDNSYDISLSISQQTNTTPQFFKMPVPVFVHTEQMDTTVILFNDEQTQWFDFTVQGEPLSIQIDPENWILKEVEDIAALEENTELPNEFYLSQNYPNPFNPSTTISFKVPASESGKLVSLKIYDSLGKEITTLVEEEKTAGQYNISWNSEFEGNNAQLASGVYYYRLVIGNFIETKKMMLLK